MGTRILLLLITLALALPLFPQGKSAAFGLPGESESPKSTATLTSELSTIVPGAPFTVALRLAHPEGWHSYYRNSGGIELPPKIQWTLPEGFDAGEIRWPAPKVEDGLLDNKSFYYAGSPTFLAEITPPASLDAGTVVELKADVTWQICRPGECLDESASFTLSLAVGQEAEVDPSQGALFADARAQLPVAAEGWTIQAESSGAEVRLLLTPPSAAAPPSDLDFFPAEPFLASISEGSTVSQDADGRWVLALKRKSEDVIGNAIPQGTEVAGILASTSPLDGNSGASAIEIPATVIGREAPRPLELSAFLPVLGLMFLGGLILNLMPCVFPVIGLKIMGFVQQSGQDRKKIVLHGIAFSAGVLISFWILSGFLFALRAQAAPGQEIGWGYQLQNPWTVLVLMLLMFVLGLSMYGLFEIGASATGVGGQLQSKEGVSGSFFSGVLATVVATPCSAPFLGVAIGTAITLPPFQFFWSFTAMALGLSLPYLVLSVFPGLVDLLPRPGAWMESFKQAMSFLLFATAGFLLWVYAGQIGLENMLNVIFGLTAIAIAAWVFGRWHTPIRRRGVKFAAIVTSLAFAAAGLKLTIPPQKSGLVWEAWSEERVAELLDGGKPVFVDFTAQWCATCQLNKRRAYPKEVVHLMQERGVVALKADKTNPNPAIDAKLQELGRSAIPVNVLYVPGKDPIITPELFGAEYMTGLITREVPAP